MSVPSFRAVGAFVISVLYAHLAFAQLRVVTYNVAQLNGDLTALQDVFAALVADDKPGFAVAPHIFVFQEVQSADAAIPSGPIITRLNAVAPAGATYVRATFTSSVNEDGSGGVQACFYRADTLIEDASGHADIFTGRGRNSDRWRFRFHDYTSPGASFYIYSSHLPAGNAPSDADDRLVGAEALRANADALPTGTHILYAGDFNLYNNLEPAYVELTSAGNGQAIDPYGSGNWTGIANALKQTQSPCNAGCALVGGGMDDRFDFVLGSSAFNNGEGLSRMTGAGLYRSLGNDGQHYNSDIDSGNNLYYPADVPRPNALAADLRIASDHIPVVSEYQIPAWMTATLTPDFGRVIEGAAVSVELAVFNDADVLVTAGADELDFSATASGELTGSAAGTIAALAAPQVQTFAINTSAAGIVSGGVQMTSTSEAVQNASITLNTGGTVVRHANASFSASADDDTTVRTLILETDSGTHTLPIGMHNFGHDSLQALLDVDSLTGLAAPLSLSGGLPGSIAGVTGTFTLVIDSDGAPSGLYAATVGVNCSDEDLPGAVISELTVNVEIRFRTYLGDIDGDCEVELDDLAAVLSAFGGCSGDETYARDGDVDNNGCIDLSDLAVVLAQFGAACG